MGRKLRSDSRWIDVGYHFFPRLVRALNQAADLGTQVVGSESGFLFWVRTDDVDRPVGSRAAVHRDTSVLGECWISSVGNRGFSAPRRGPGLKVTGMDTTPVMRRFPG